MKIKGKILSLALVVAMLTFIIQPVDVFASAVMTKELVASGGNNYFNFTPGVTGTYVVSSHHDNIVPDGNWPRGEISFYVNGWVLDKNGNEINYIEKLLTTAGGRSDFKDTVKLTAGTTYQISSRMYHLAYNAGYGYGDSIRTTGKPYTVTIELLSGSPSAPSTAAPVLSRGSAARNSATKYTLTFTSSKAGTMYSIIRDYGSSAPTASYVASDKNKDLSVSSGANKINFTKGSSDTVAKDTYVVVKDSEGKLSNVLKITIPAW